MSVVRVRLWDRGRGGSVSNSPSASVRRLFCFRVTWPDRVSEYILLDTQGEGARGEGCDVRR